MDWFFALEGPTQVAIVGVLAGVIAALGAVGVAALNTHRSGGGSNKAEIAALTIDSTAIKQVSASIDALTKVLDDQNRLVTKGGDEMVDVMERVTKEIEELRRELRAMSDKMASRGA